VAVKLIRAELAGNPDFRMRFAREVAAARTVGGIFTAPVVDADPDGPEPWLVTAYVEGSSLADVVADRGPLPVSSVLTLAAGLAEGLGAIHAAGVVHRDLKPSNVLLASDGPRIIDFGISRAVDATSLTHAGRVVGSPGFMSPEQAQGHEVGPASDVFSLGAVLAFAATGEEPFGSGIATVLLYRVVYGSPDVSRLPVLIRPLIERCLTKDARLRPSTDELLAELGAAHPEAGWLPWTVGPALADQSLAVSAPPVSAPPVSAPPVPAASMRPVRTPTELAGPSGQPGSGVASHSSPGPAAGGGPLSDAASAGSATAGPAARNLVAGPISQREWLPGTATPTQTAARPARWVWAACALAAIIAVAGAAVLVLTLNRPEARQPRSSTRSSADQTPAVTSPHAPSPRAVVEAYIAAINRRDWPAVWRLGGKNLGQSYDSMIAGFRLTQRDVVTRISSRGDSVSARILAYETTGAVQTYALRYVVHADAITSGRSTLLGARSQ
jgi:serine/threonine protein kinase